MKKLLTILLISSIFAFIPFLQSCSDDDDTVAPATEVIANDATFAGFMSWSKDQTRKGIDPSLGGAHEGNDSTVTRDVYFKNGISPINGVYPTGATIVKHTYNSDKTLENYTAMVKRGGEFNKAQGGWEYFMIGADGKIAENGSMRGANLMNGMCYGCHVKANPKDYIFTK